MITHRTGDIFDSRATAIVIPVNVVGVMGAGLAKHAARRWPGLVMPYKAACRDGQLRIGQCWRWVGTHPMVICFPTKGDWRKPSWMEYIDRGLVSLVDLLKRDRIESVAVPALGCGLGGLRWDDVRPKIVSALEPLNCAVEVWAP